MIYRPLFPLLCVLASAVGLLHASSAHAQELITNGGFETNSGTGSSAFAGWTVTRQMSSAGNWYVQTGTQTPISHFSVAAPPQGAFAAMSDTVEPGSQVLIQDFTVPLVVGNATLSFARFLYFDNKMKNLSNYVSPNTLDFTVVPNEQARVDILLGTATAFSVSASDVLFNAFHTTPSDPATFGYNTLTVDLTSVLQAHAGETLRLRFAEVDNEGILNFGVDSVSLAVSRTSSVPEPGSIALLVGMGLSGVGFLAHRKRVRLAA